MKVTSILFSTVAMWAATVAAGPAPDAAALAELVTDAKTPLEARQSCCPAFLCNRGGCRVSLLYRYHRDMG
jgi:hypothetical protein